VSARPGGVEVVVDRVSKSFEGGTIRALRDVSFRLDPGDVVSLTGPSGGGKSTLLNLIGALDKPDSGSIAVAGRRLEELRDGSEYRAATVGFVFQFHHLIPTLSAAENVQVPMMGRGLGRAERERRSLELLEDCAIGQRAKASPATLSGGERQRVAIARALANGPPLLLADEPTGNLHSGQAREIMELFRDLNQHGTTIVQVTHSEVNAGYGSRTIQLRDGWNVADTANPSFDQPTEVSAS